MIWFPIQGLSHLSRGQLHDLFKRAMYKDIAAATGITLPWGFLTGVKPAKRITELLKKTPNADESTVRRKFETMYLVRPDKSRLAYEVAVNEESILRDRLKEKVFQSISVSHSVRVYVITVLSVPCRLLPVVRAR